MHSISSRWLCCLVLLVFSFSVGEAWGQSRSSLLASGVQQDKKKTKQNSKPKSGKNVTASQSAKPPSATTKINPKKPAPISAARRKEIFDFVQQHVPEIRPMLGTLQRKNKGQFDVAMRGLDREIRTLNNQKTRSPERYPLSLELWTVRSEVKLMAARIATTKSEKQAERLKKEIKVLIEKQYALRRTQLEKDLKGYQSRVDKVKKQISQLNQQKEKEMKRQIDAMNNAAKRLKNNSKRPGSNKKNKSNKDAGD